MLSIQCFTVNPFQENTYILYNEHNDAVIVDPGFSTESERKQIFSFIDQHHLKLTHLINTHAHIDHVLGNEFIGQQYHLPLELHEGELVVLDHVIKAAEMYGVDYTPFSGEKVFLTEGDTIHIGEDELEILFTPGHSPASISFYNKKQGFLISGDVLFSGSIGRTDLPGGDFNALEKSIREKLYVLPDETKVYPGHGRGTSIGYEKVNNPFVKAV